MKKSTTSRVRSKRDSRSDRKHGKGSAARFSVRELGSRTWPDFERVVEKHNGVWGDCWCVAFHLKRSEEKQWAGKHRALKQKLVRANRSHAALVYDGADVVGWCQFGPPAELPARMSGFNRLDEAQPDWRITCFFVDRDHRKEGVEKAAVEGALGLISSKGFYTLLSCPRSEVLKINLLPKLLPLSFSLFQVNLAFPELCGGQPVYYQLLNSYDPHLIRASVNDSCLLRVCSR